MNLEERINIALSTMEKKGHHISSTKKIKSRDNINANIIRLNESKKSYALKLYKEPSAEDPRKRCKAEKDFYNYMESLKVDSIAKPIEFDCNHHWSIISWIDGEKKHKLSKTEIENIANFIATINKLENKEMAKGLDFASEACRSAESVSKAIRKRLKQLREAKADNKLKEEIKTWANDIITNSYIKAEREFIEKRSIKSHWKSKDIGKYVSPSDIGLHNMLFVEGKIYFIDFEYSGRDDISKLIADLVLQPNYCFSRVEEEIVLKSLEQNLDCKDRGWIERYYDIKEIIRIKWCLIMLNGFMANNITIERFQRIKEYLHRGEGK